MSKTYFRHLRNGAIFCANLIEETQSEYIIDPDSISGNKIGVCGLDRNTTPHGLPKFFYMKAADEEEALAFVEIQLTTEVYEGVEKPEKLRRQIDMVRGLRKELEANKAAAEYWTMKDE